MFMFLTGPYKWLFYIGTVISVLSVIYVKGRLDAKHAQELETLRNQIEIENDKDIINRDYDRCLELGRRWVQSRGGC